MTKEEQTLKNKIVGLSIVCWTVAVGGIISFLVENYYLLFVLSPVAIILYLIDVFFFRRYLQMTK